MSTNNALLTILTERIRTNSLVLPTLPEIAIKVRKAADDPDINLKAMGAIIAQDPSLSARIIGIANSAVRSRTTKVSDLNQAVTRIGLAHIKNVATALAMEQLFVSKNDTIRKEMSRAWKETVEVASHAMAGFKLWQERTRNRTLSLDTLTLTAMVHNIGILPILTEAEKHEDVFGELEFIQDASQKLGNRIGEMITQKWEFADPIISAVSNWRKVGFAEDIEYTDFIKLAYVAINGGQEDAFVQRGLIEEEGFANRADYQSAVRDAASAFA